MEHRSIPSWKKTVMPLCRLPLHILNNAYKKELSSPQKTEGFNVTLRKNPWIRFLAHPIRLFLSFKKNQ